MVTIKLPRAVRYNQVMSGRLGWRQNFAQLVELMHYDNMTPDEREFVRGIARLQEQVNETARSTQLAVDGMLGPKTWGLIQHKMNFTPAHALSPPRWLDLGLQPVREGFDLAELDKVDRIGKR